MTETRNPAERITSISDCVTLCVQQALTWPSKPLLDCIPVADIDLTYSWRDQFVGQVRDILIDKSEQLVKNCLLLKDIAFSN